MHHLAALEAFVIVVDSGSFTAAAGELGVSKSHVSKLVSGLEDLLGVRLLHRTTRRLSLTDVGRAFYERCARALEEITDAQQAVTEASDTPRGTLRVSVPLSFGTRYIAPLVSEFVARYPHLKVEMDFSDRRVHLIDEGFDLVVRIGALEDSSLIARRIAPTRMHLVASPGYVQAHGVPMAPRDLKDHDCILYALSASGPSWAFTGPDGERTAVRVSGRVTMNNGDGIVAAAAAGLGIARLPDFLVADALADGRVVPLLRDHIESDAAVWAVYPHTRHLATRVRRFVDFLVERLGDDCPWIRAADAALASVDAADSAGRI